MPPVGFETKISAGERPKTYALDQGFSKGVPQHTSVPRNFGTVPREKVLGKCEHIKKGLSIKYLSSVTY